jgi:GNAT superfamily N-acetyltransferase
MSTQVSVERAELRHIDEIAPLFDAYRRFYGQVDDPRARSFLEERVAHDESVVFIARLQGAAIGFCQLYPCFASVSLTRMFVLYDLFVAPQARRCGAAAALLRTAVDYAAGQGAGQLMLQTAARICRRNVCMSARGGSAIVNSTSTSSNCARASTID